MRARHSIHGCCWKPWTQPCGWCRRPRPPRIVPRLVTLEERAAVIRAALQDTPVIVLQDLLEDLTDKVVVAITFLAMLELVKGHELSISQEQPFGPIVCRSLGAP